MQTTMNLLDDALKIKDIAEWTNDLKLSAKALYNAKYREHLSPAIAGVLAEKLGKNVNAWIVIAALESEKDSACKEHLLKKLQRLSDVI